MQFTDHQFSIHRFVIIIIMTILYDNYRARYKWLKIKSIKKLIIFPRNYISERIKYNKMVGLQKKKNIYIYNATKFTKKI